MKISKNFSLSELTKSDIAIRNGIDNSPNAGQLECIITLVNGFLQPLRDKVGMPIKITSCFRKDEIDTILVGYQRSTPSQHVKGEAADFEVPGMDNLDLAEYIRDNMDFDQLILEYYENGKPDSGWVHCSYKKSGNRKEVLRARLLENKKTQYTKGLN